MAAALALLIPATWGIYGRYADRVAGRPGDHQSAAVNAAFAQIERSFDALQQSMMASARALAEEKALQEGLVLPPSQARERVVRFAASLSLEEKTAAEFYTAEGTLAGWTGFGMPLDREPGSLDPNRVSIGIADAAGREQALVVWWPVRKGDRTVGFVRFMRLVVRSAPVENQYLQSFSLAEEWQALVGMPVSLALGAAAADPGTPLYREPLEGADGSRLGLVVLQPPTPAALRSILRTRYADVALFWTTLLFAWLLYGLWLWYREQVRTLSMEASPDRKRSRWSAVLRFLVLGVAWWGVRFALVVMQVPARWQTNTGALAPLFDPAHLASLYGFGMMRSAGDLLITAIFAVLFGAALLDLLSRFRDAERRLIGPSAPHGSAQDEGCTVCFFVISVLAALATLTSVAAMSALTEHAVLDSTLDFFARTGLVPDRPERLVLVVYVSLVLLSAATMMVSIGVLWVAITLLLRHRPERWSLVLAAAVAAGCGAAALLGVYVAGASTLVPVVEGTAFLLTAAGVAAYARIQLDRGARLLTVRTLLLSAFALSVLLYPLLYNGMDERQRMQIVEAADSFLEERDPRIVFAIEQVLEQSRTHAHLPDIRRSLEKADTSRATRHALDSLAASLLRGSLLSELGPYDVSLAILDTGGKPLGRYQESESIPAGMAVQMIDSTEFDILLEMFSEVQPGEVMVEQVTGRHERDRFQYVGIVPIAGASAEEPLGWIMARAESRSLQEFNETPFPRVLLPSGYFRTVRANVSLAGFRNGVLVRSLGRDFGQFMLDPAVRAALLLQPEVWVVQRMEGERYLTYYRRELPDASAGGADLLGQRPLVVAARVPATYLFDHLYYLLRLIVAALIVGLPIYLVGLYFGRQAGKLPAQNVRFREKVLNAFLVVGIISVAAVGFVGQDVVREETQNAVRTGIRRSLEDVERILTLQARGSELPYQVLRRTPIDSLAAVAGVDLNVYVDGSLVQTTRPQLVRDRLLDERLSAEAYRSIYLDGQRTTFVPERVGSFEYIVGHHALLDEQGAPRYVVSVPALQEQEQIQDERARTTAYFFGALLLLLLVIMLTASVVANALTRPIARLRLGLEQVARGRFEQSIPVTSRDEIGDLVQTFNEMQEQLAESRRQLAQQERQLAWREMARQVAHEIKNPLTPMKLSVQHLQRAFTMSRAAQVEEDAPVGKDFKTLFRRITATLVEQIDTLARIANEFHSFARMPTRMEERLDMNAVVSEAVALMQEETSTEVLLTLYRDALIVQADREELRRAFINLIKNALQAVPDGTEGLVQVETGLTPGVDGRPALAMCRVTDNGTGISEELREKIFQPNFSTKTSGTGLGLAIARKSIEESGGEIDFDPEVADGASFWVKLPLCDAEPEGAPAMSR